jgi:hypothetical protein
LARVTAANIASSLRPKRSDEWSRSFTTLLKSMVGSDTSPPARTHPWSRSPSLSLLFTNRKDYAKDCQIRSRSVFLPSCIDRSAYRLAQNLLDSWYKNQRQHWMEMFVEVTELPPLRERCCRTCTDEEAIYLCDSCEGISFSQHCLLLEHQTRPFHLIKVFESFYLSILADILLG